ncbi:hypothetical protein [Desulfobacula sp.]|uniref:hypothetical protein n=1 Tax=Desulfobacula sp. TaxID=2593537 RepID=UPI00262CD570|nr:hypothetical protein [Desulfobacula sp.]
MKQKSSYICLAFISLLTSAIVWAAHSDINNDTVFDLRDIHSILQICSGNHFAAPYPEETDVNKDNKVGMEEAIYNLGRLENSDGMSSEFTLRPEGGTISAGGNSIEVIIPSDAVVHPTRMIVSIPDNYPVIQEITPLRVVQIGPVELKFNEQVNMRIHYDPAELPVGYHYAALQICRISGNQWQPVKTSVSPYGQYATTPIDRFGTYCLAVMNYTLIHPGRAIITTMAELESFAGYQGIAGSIEISGKDITSLETLSSLKWTSRIKISDCDSLVSLAGLSSLEYVSDFIQVINNPQLQDFSLPALKSIGSNCWIGRNAALASVNMPKLKQAGKNRTDNFEICDNPKLEYIGNLNSLETLSGSLLIKNNSLLRNLEGLNGLISIGNSLGISYLENLVSLQGITSLERAGSLSINNCNGLPTLGGLSTLRFVETDIRIESNNALNLLTGLNAAIGGGLTIKENPSLVNMSGLGVTTVGDNVNLWKNNGLTNLNGLSIIQKMAGLQIEHCASLRTLSGIGNHPLIGVILIHDNDSLLNLNGLESVIQAHFVQIYDNKVLENLNGLNQLTHVENLLIIQQNEQLENIDALSALFNIGGLRIQSNPNLQSVSGLSGLTRLGWTGTPTTSFFEFIDCDDVTTIEPLTHLQVNPATGFVIPDHLMITENADLPLGDASARLFLKALGGESVIGGEIIIGQNT